MPKKKVAKGFASILTHEMQTNMVLKMNKACYNEYSRPKSIYKGNKNCILLKKCLVTTAAVDVQQNTHIYML